MYRLLPILFLALLYSCETKEIYELPSSTENFIELDIDGRMLMLDSRPQIYSGYYYRSSDATDVRIEHSTSDHLHAITMNLAGCAFGPEDAPMALGTKAGSGESPCATELPSVTIGYTTYELGGDPSCPHLEGVPTQLTGTVNIESWTQDGRVKGTFETDRDADHDYVLSGRFDTAIE